MKRYIGIDIGGTAIKYGVLSERGDFIRRGKRKTESYKGGPSVYAKIEEIVKELCTAEDISGICVSTAGIVDIEKGEITHAALLMPGYAGVQIKEGLEERFGLPCEVENDVNCAGLAEYISGAAKGRRITLMLTVGTGIGGSVVIDGEIFRGSGGSACEVGYMLMRGSDFQSLGAASVLTKKVAGWKKEPKELWNGYRVFEEARQGDLLCRRAIDEMTDVLGQGIANICYVLNPEIVVLGGGIMAQKDFLKGKIRHSVKKYLIPGIADRTEIEFAKHENDAGMLGALYHFQRCRDRRQKHDR